MSVQPIPSEMVHPYVECRPGVQGGRPVIKGSRFPVTSIVQDYHRGQSIEEILHDFPSLTPAEVHDALSYYYDHRVEIDQYIAELTDIDTIMKKYPPTILPPKNGKN